MGILRHLPRLDLFTWQFAFCARIRAARFHTALHAEEFSYLSQWALADGTYAVFIFLGINVGFFVVLAVTMGSRVTRGYSKRRRIARHYDTVTIYT
jgi:hypothetical protein